MNIVVASIIIMVAFWAFMSSLKDTIKDALREHEEEKETDEEELISRN